MLISLVKHPTQCTTFSRLIKSFALKKMMQTLAFSKVIHLCEAIAVNNQIEIR